MDALRAQVLAAARRTLVERDGAAAFSVDAVAAKAGVARSLVHQQFGTVGGVLEALLDDLAAHRALAVELPGVFQLRDPLDTLAEFIAVFGRVWEAERIVMRRVRNLAALDPELARALAKREDYRREGLRRLLTHLTRNGVGLARGPFEPLDVLFTLTAFETFDSLAGAERRVLDVVPVVQHLVRSALGLGVV
jgi:AcrR family transcriptional regulator